jgi:hypothetical protein
MAQNVETKGCTDKTVPASWPTTKDRGLGCSASGHRVRAVRVTIGGRSHPSNARVINSLCHQIPVRKRATNTLGTHKGLKAHAFPHDTDITHDPSVNKTENFALSPKGWHGGQKALQWTLLQTAHQSSTRFLTVFTYSESRSNTKTALNPNLCNMGDFRKGHMASTQSVLAISLHP